MISARGRTTRPALAWVALACAIGFLVPAVFSMGLRWERTLFLVPYVAIIGAFLFAFFRRVSLSRAELVGSWTYGLIAVAVATLLLIRNIQGQPPSAVPEGGRLVAAIAWLGVVYGALDGLFLNVLPVLAVTGPPAAAAGRSWRQRLAGGLLGLVASVCVVVAYHLGYTEFHGARMGGVVIGNVIITSTYLLSGSPLAAVVTHVLMHVAAVLHGMETTMQLPPHS